MRVSRPIIAFSAALMLYSAPLFAADSSDMAKIQAKLDAMMARMEKLETENKELRTMVQKRDVAPAPQTASHTATAPATAASNAPASAAPAATAKAEDPNAPKIKIGGYVKADAIMDVGTGYGADFGQFAAISLNSSATGKKDSDFHMHARQTRLNLTATTPTEFGDVKAFIEGDFYGTRGTDLISNGHNPQLRHAYGQVGGLLIGQTWTNFADMDAWPESLDYVGPAGLTMVRQVQVRYTDTLDNDGLGYSIAAENPNADTTKASGFGDTISEYDAVPDVTASLTQKGKWGHVSMRAMGRSIGIQNETTNHDDSKFGYGLALSTKLMVDEKDNIKARFAIGNGIGRYLYDAATGSSAKGAAVSAAGLDLIPAHAAYVAYQHHWSPELRSNLMGGYTAMDNPTGLLGTAYNETVWSGHANLIWQPAKAYSLGLEYIQAHREQDNGQEGDLSRVQFSAFYNF